MPPEGGASYKVHGGSQHSRIASTGITARKRSYCHGINGGQGRALCADGCEPCRAERAKYGGKPRILDRDCRLANGRRIQAAPGPAADTADAVLQRHTPGRSASPRSSAGRECEASNAPSRLEDVGHADGNQSHRHHLSEPAGVAGTSRLPQGQRRQVRSAHRSWHDAQRLSPRPERLWCGAGL